MVHLGEQEPSADHNEPEIWMRMNLVIIHKTVTMVQRK